MSLIYNNDQIRVRRGDCLGCDAMIVTARDPHVLIGGRRDGTGLLVFDAKPQRISKLGIDDLTAAADLYLLGVAHRDCVTRAVQRLQAGDVALADDLRQLRVTDDDTLLPRLHQPPGPDHCPFCDSTEQITDEDVIPKWVTAVLKERGGGSLLDLTGEHGPRRVYTINTTAPVCGRCNNQWMSVLEQDVRPILEPMIRGQDRVVLSLDEQTVLAFWAAKTAMMFDRASATPIIPAGFFHLLRQQKEPLASHRVWTGAYLSSGRNLAAWNDHVHRHIGIPTTQPPNAHVTTFSIGHAVFQVLGHFASGDVTINDQRVYKDALAELWPTRHETLDWPPNHLSFGDKTLVTLAGSLG